MKFEISCPGIWTIRPGFLTMVLVVLHFSKDLIFVVLKQNEVIIIHFIPFLVKLSPGYRKGAVHMSVTPSFWQENTVAKKSICVCISCLNLAYIIRMEKRSNPIFW